MSAMLQPVDPREVRAGRRPARIAYLVYRFQTGGLERCVARLCNRLDRDVFEPMVLCLECSDRGVEWLERDDIPVIEVHKRPRNDWGAIRRLAGVLRDHSVEILHSQNWGTLVEASLARGWAGTPVHVHTEHGQGLHDGLGAVKRLVRRWATRWSFERTDAVLICAESIRNRIHQRSGYPSERLEFVPNGVERPPAIQVGEPVRMRRQLGVESDAFVLGSVGRLVAVKGYTMAVDVVARLVERGTNAHLVLVGDGPEAPRLHADAVRRGLSERVHLVGRQVNVGDWLKTFDVYLNTSRSEAMSLGILEAMAAGRSMVVTDAGDNASLVDGPDPCGIVVPPGDSRAMADAVGRLEWNRRLRETMEQNAERRFTEAYSLERMLQRHVELYTSLLAGPRRETAA